MLRRIRKPPVPPSHLWPDGRAFAPSAQRTARFLAMAANLREDARILDVGCGTGRLALGLRDHLGPDGRYVGFDVNREALRWARRHVGRGDPRLRFEHVDVYNGSYNRAGSIPPAEFRFPHDQDSFDLVVLYSVFTHMVTEDVRHYLDEIARVLAPGGTSVATFYLMDGPRVMRTPNETWDFSHRIDEFFTADPNVPERAIGYPEAIVTRLYEDAGMRVASIEYGQWQGNRDAHSWQDAVVATSARSRDA